jgi:uncharacterized protein
VARRLPRVVRDGALHENRIEETMNDLRRAAADFLAQRRIAVAGVARDGGSAANVVYRRLREKGYEVFALNPSANEVEGDRCYASVGAVPGGVDGVVIGTPPQSGEPVVRDCLAAGVPRVWFHRSFGTGSVSADAVALAEREGLAVIAGACPMMFIEPVDPAHRCMRWVLGAIGRLPDTTAYSPAVGSPPDGSFGTAAPPRSL